MAKAVLTKDIPSIQERKTKERKKQDKAGAFRGKKWKNLTPEQKDKLLKAMAIRFGFLDNEED
jgi:hypothetical protein